MERHTMQMKEKLKVFVRTGHQRLPFKLLEVEGDLLQVNEGHLGVLQHRLLIRLEERYHISVIGLQQRRHLDDFLIDTATQR